MKQFRLIRIVLLCTIIFYACDKQAMLDNLREPQSYYRIDKEMAESNAMELVNELYYSKSRNATPYHADETIIYGKQDTILSDMAIHNEPMFYITYFNNG